jgi:hypothetical protein
MSHRHNHAPKHPAEPAAQVHFWPIALLAIVLGLPLAIFIYGRAINSFYDTEHLTTTGAISETRVVADSFGSGYRDGWIHYRLEARVAYQIDSHSYDEWLRVPQFESSRAALEAVQARHPESCQVYWSPGHPETARCRLQ